MENKINIENLILNQQALSLDLKTKFEAKASNYLAIVALIMSALLQFHVKGTFYTFTSLKCLEKISFIIYIFAFLSGLFVLVICSIMLYPRKILYLNNDKLNELYDLEKKYDGEFDKFILSENTRCVNCNMQSIEKLKFYNRLASFGLMFMVFNFIVCGILFLI